MKRSVRLWMAMVTFIAVMFSSTVCYGAESSGGKAGEAESEAVTRSVNTQSASAFFDAHLDCEGIDVIVKVKVTYSWDEGYTGWFDSWEVYRAECDGHDVKLESCTTAPNGSYLTFTFTVSLDDIMYRGATIFYVNEYGEVSY